MDLTHVVGPIILACAILYAIPATAVLGAILVTGFLGGAVCAHVRIGELGSPPELISLLLGALTWGGLYARDARIWASSAAWPVEPTGCSPQKQEKTHVSSHGESREKSAARRQSICRRAAGEVRALVRNRAKASSWA